MIFKGEPNLYVRISQKYVQRVTGKKGFHFNENGRFETENEVLVKLLSQHFEAVEKLAEEQTELLNEENNAPSEEIAPPIVETKNNASELTDAQIRALAKEKGIKNWHNKKIANLIKELEGV